MLQSRGYAVDNSYTRQKKTAKKATKAKPINRAHNQPPRPKISRDHSEYQPRRVLFAKYQVIIGAKFINTGRTSLGEPWTVTKILSWANINGKIERRSVKRVRRLDDSVQLINPDGEVRVIVFSSFSYSATWEQIGQLPTYTPED